MKRVERYIPIAIDVVEDLFINRGDIVSQEFDNIASKFGLSVRQLGVKTAVIAFSAQKSDIKKTLVTKAILRIIKLDETGICSKNETLQTYVFENIFNPLLKTKLMDASVSLKLAFRLFIENESNSNEKEEENYE